MPYSQGLRLETYEVCAQCIFPDFDESRLL